eukprot:TRINITY_DN14986_c0_g1_i1.p1 TRINITY_DN14986_c0_g1~~TRINITY_DN14986_c0_g1_i1.p1  ORF type:complete len:607 (-),score=102.93 TRINITY_DN14986_c0_g1_i1:24-1814(-)
MTEPQTSGNVSGSSGLDVSEGDAASSQDLLENNRTPVTSTPSRLSSIVMQNLPKVLHFLFFSASGSLVPFLPLFYRGILTVISSPKTTEASTSSSSSSTSEEPLFYYDTPLTLIGALTAIPPLFSLLLQPLWSVITAKVKKQQLMLMISVILALGFVLAIGLVTSGNELDNVIYLLPLVVGYALFNMSIDTFLDNAISELYEEREPQQVNPQRKAAHHQKAFWSPMGFSFGALLVAITAAVAPFWSPMYSYIAQMLLLFLSIVYCLEHDREEENEDSLEGRANNEEAPATLLASPSDDSISTMSGDTLIRRNNSSKQRNTRGNKRKNAFNRLLRSLLVVIKNRQAFFFLQSFLILAACSAISSSFLFIYAVEQLHANLLQLSLIVVVSSVAEILAVLFAPLAIRKIGLGTTIVAANLAWGVRGVLYTVLTPWLLVLVEILHGISYAGFFIAGPVSFGAIAPKGLELTPQSMIQVVYYLGCAIGSVVGGLLYASLGPIVLFRAAGIAATAGLFFLILFSRFVDAKLNEIPVLSLIRSDIEAEAKGGVFELEAPDAEEGIEMVLISQDNSEEAEVQNEMSAKSSSSRRKEKLPDLDEE